MISAGNCRVYASEGEELIHYDIDRTAPALVRRSSVMLPVFVQAACRHADLQVLYVASSAGGYAAGDNPIEEHYLSAFRIEPSGSLTPFGDHVPLPYRPVYISLDRASAHILVAYSDPPALTVLSLLDDGGIGEEKPHAPLEMRKFPHHIGASPQDDFISVCATGQDSMNDPSEMRGGMHAFAYDHGAIGDVIGSPAPNDGIGFSPRHVDFHPSLPFAYVSLERQSELHVFGYGPHGFDAEPIFTATTLEGGRSKANQYCGTVCMHPSGRFVFVANRSYGTYEEDGKTMISKGGDDIAVFEIDQQSGRPTLIQRIDAEGIMPRTMGTDPDGELLVVSNQFTVEGFDGDEWRTVPQSLIMYRISSDGKLTRVWRHELELTQKPMIWMGVIPT